MNDELESLSDLGTPMNVASTDSLETRTTQLQRINSSLTLRSGLGQSLVAATTENEDLPAVYRSALEAGLHSNQLSTTLDCLCRQKVAEDEVRSTLGRALVPPLVILILGYFGFIFLCVYVLPTLVEMYEQVGETPSISVQVLMVLRDWLPVWATLVPLLMLGAVILWRRGWGNWQRLIPGAKRHAETVCNANFAGQLALLLESGVSLAEGLPVAAKSTGDQQLIAAAAELHPRSDDAAKVRVNRRLSPLLRWALTKDLGEQSLPEVLRFAEQTYRQAAERRAASWRFVLPAVIGAALGGTVVFMYGLSLFLPFIHLLRDLAE